MMTNFAYQKIMYGTAARYMILKLEKLIGMITLKDKNIRPRGYVGIAMQKNFNLDYKIVLKKSENFLAFFLIYLINLLQKLKCYLSMPLFTSSSYASFDGIVNFIITNIHHWSASVQPGITILSGKEIVSPHHPFHQTVPSISVPW